MNRKILIFILICIIVVLVGWGKYIIPIKLEISDTQVVEVIGIDSSDSNFSVSLLFEPHQAEKGNKGEEEKNLVVTAKTFVEAEKGIQNYTDKIFIGSHIKDVVIGEEIAKNNLTHAIEFLSKNNDFRLGSKIYIAKNSSASNLFNEGVGNNYSLSSRIDKLSLSERGKFDSSNVEVVDVVRMLLSENKSGVIPCIQVVKNGDIGNNNYTILTDEKEKNRVEFAGYAVIKDGKLFGYLDNDERKGYDIIRNILFEDAIKIDLGGKIVGLELVKSKSDLKYNFNGDTLSNVIVEIKTKNSVLETSSGENVFKKELGLVEELENIYIQNLVKNVIKYSQNSNIDFLEVGGMLELKHPYKWEKIKENWSEIFPNIPIYIKVNSDIKEQYGILASRGEK